MSGLEELDQTGTGATEIAVRLPSARNAEGEVSLDSTALAGTWHEQLEHWLDEATSAGIPEPNAMVLATADAEGMPSSRTVLCKGLDERGIVFYTNYTSAKSRDLAATRFAAVTFLWRSLHRQVNVRGEVEQVTRAETADYWGARPRGSQLGAWASPQSRVVAGRRDLDNALSAVQRRFADVEEVPAPPHWGGWRLSPRTVEFWQGQQDRLHDRLRYVRTEDDWRIERVAP